MVEVRIAAGTDAGAIAALMTELGYPCSGDDVAARLGYWLADPMSRVLVAEHDGLVIGCLSVHAVPYLERTGRWARIESLVIDESARGTGVGRALLRTAENVARRWECLAMEVTSARTRHSAHASTSGWVIPTCAAGPADSSRNSSDSFWIAAEAALFCCQ